MDELAGLPESVRKLALDRFRLLQPLAYPAEYRSPGVMTFMINQDGVVVQKDLGPDTAAIASQTREFNPDTSWDQIVE
jgi:hypothetical protein